MISKVRVSRQPPEVSRFRSFLGTVPLPPVCCGPAWDAYFAYTRLWSVSGTSKGGMADINKANQWTVRLLGQDIVQTCLSLAAVGTLEPGKGTQLLGVRKKEFRRASLLSSAKPSRSLPFSLSTARPYTPNTLLPASPLSSPLFPVLAFASVETKTYFRAGTHATVLLRAAMYLAFCRSVASSQRMHSHRSLSRRETESWACQLHGSLTAGTLKLDPGR